LFEFYLSACEVDIGWRDVKAEFRLYDNVTETDFVLYEDVIDGLVQRVSGNTDTDYEVC
jgi:hypothetical protein